MKNRKQSLALSALLASALFGLHGTSLAQNKVNPFDLHMLFTHEQMDKNHDGMVSKTEFMAMASKAYDMQAKEMGLKDGKMTQAQLDEFIRNAFK